MASHQSSDIDTERIAICTVGELFGGVERHVISMMTGLLGQDAIVLLVLFCDGELASQSRALGVEPVILSGRKFTVLSTARRLARILEQQSIRIVHVHGYKATVFCALARRWHHFSMVKTEHGLPEPMAGGLVRALRNRLYHFSDGIATRISRATVCYVTDELQRHFRQTHHGLRTMVISNGVANMDRGQFPRPPEMRKDWFNLVIAGRLDLVKGHHWAIRAVATVDLSPEVHLHILGDGPCAHELQALAGSLAATHRVHIHGFRRNIHDYMAHCDALLMPSLHEGLPYTLLEAMALAVPIVVTRVGGPAEVVRNDDTGLLVRPRDDVTIAGAIRRLHRDTALRVRLGEAAQQDQRARYSLGSMTQAYIEVYRNQNCPAR